MFFCIALLDKHCESHAYNHKIKSIRQMMRAEAQRQVRLPALAQLLFPRYQATPPTPAGLHSSLAF